MLTRKQSLSASGILILITIAIFLLSQRTPPETIVKYNVVEFSPKTETQSESQSNPNSEVEMRAVNEDIDSSEPNTDADVEPTEDSNLLDELLFSEILDETEDNTIFAEDPEATEDNGYPEVPARFPFSLVWEAPEEQLAQMPSVLFEELELMGLVMIKLWNEGDQGFSGAFMSDGKVYPTYSDVAYVKWEETEESGERRISEVSTVHSSISEQLLNGVIPPGIEIVDQDSSGIDPHAFLSQ